MWALCSLPHSIWRGVEEGCNCQVMRKERAVDYYSHGDVSDYFILATNTFKATSSSGLGLWNISQTWPKDYKQTCPEDGGCKYSCVSADESKALPGLVLDIAGGSGRNIRWETWNLFLLNTGNHFSYCGCRTEVIFCQHTLASYGGRYASS